MRVTREQVRALAGSAALLGTFPAAFVAKPWIVATTLIVCPFRAVTGRPCLFCGLTRAFAHAMHSEFTEASRLNPFWWAAALLVSVMGVALLVKAVRPNAAALRWIMWRPVDSWMLVILVVAGSVLRALFGGAAV